MRNIIQRLCLFKKRTGYLPDRVSAVLVCYLDDASTISQVQAEVDKTTTKLKKVISEDECAGITLGEKAFLDEFYERSNSKA